MKTNWKFLGLLVIIVIVLFAVLVLITPASATSWGGDLQYLNYSVNALPNNSYVHQGDNITQGNWYDLSGVYGFSGVVASWKDDFDDAGVTSPDYVVTLTNPASVYIDPNIFPAGRWYQWDGAAGCYGGISSSSSNGGTILGATPTTLPSNDYCMSGFGNDNAYVFAVAPPNGTITQQMQTVVVNKTMNITEQVGNQTIVIPVNYTETITEVVTPAPVANQQTVTLPPTETTAPDVTEQNVVDVNGDPVNGVAGGVQEVTPGSPVPISVTLIGIIAAIGVLIWKRNQV